MVSLTVLSISCSTSNQFSTRIPGQDGQNSDSDNSSAETPTPNLPAPPEYKMIQLSWENLKFPERSSWSLYLQKIILEDWNSLLPGSNDILEFCPTYSRLENEERANVWAQIFAAISRYESNYNPVTRMQETTMGTDPVTNQPVYSEGLLQLSYQDIRWAPWCEFDWTQDRNLPPSDPRKTILNPFKNLYCGVGIMAKQIKNRGSIVLSTGVYWAVIKEGGRYQQISGIKEIVRSLPLCK